MKDYIIYPNEQSKYIRNVKKMPGGTLTIEFGDGKVFTNVETSEINLQKIAKIQEEQAKRGIAHFISFKNRAKQSKAKTIFAGVGTLAATVGATFIPAIHRIVTDQNPVLIATGIGALTLLGTIPAYAQFRRDKDAVTELEKLRYRNEHMTDLQNFRNYPNSLSGVNDRTAHWISRSKDPFSILHVDGYTKKDLMQIVDNIELEKSLNLKYQEGRTPRGI